MVLPALGTILGSAALASPPPGDPPTGGSGKRTNGPTGQTGPTPVDASPTDAVDPKGARTKKNLQTMDPPNLETHGRDHVRVGKVTADGVSISGKVVDELGARNGAALGIKVTAEFGAWLVKTAKNTRALKKLNPPAGVMDRLANGRVTYDDLAFVARAMKSYDAAQSKGTRSPVVKALAKRFVEKGQDTALEKTLAARWGTSGNIRVFRKYSAEITKVREALAAAEASGDAGKIRTAERAQTKLIGKIERELGKADKAHATVFNPFRTMAPSASRYASKVEQELKDVIQKAAQILDKTRDEVLDALQADAGVEKARRVTWATLGRTELETAKPAAGSGKDKVVSLTDLVGWYGTYREGAAADTNVAAGSKIDLRGGSVAGKAYGTAYARIVLGFDLAPTLRLSTTNSALLMNYAGRLYSDKGTVVPNKANAGILPIPLDNRIDLTWTIADNKTERADDPENNPKYIQKLTFGFGILDQDGRTWYGDHFSGARRFMSDISLGSRFDLSIGPEAAYHLTLGAFTLDAKLGVGIWSDPAVSYNPKDNESRDFSSGTQDVNLSISPSYTVADRVQFKPTFHLKKHFGENDDTMLIGALTIRSAILGALSRAKDTGFLGLNVTSLYTALGGDQSDVGFHADLTYNALGWLTLHAGGSYTDLTVDFNQQPIGQNGSLSTDTAGNLVDPTRIFSSVTSSEIMVGADFRPIAAWQSFTVYGRLTTSTGQAIEDPATGERSGSSRRVVNGIVGVTQAF
jgi:hypothetical protein